MEEMEETQDTKERHKRNERDNEKQNKRESENANVTREQKKWKQRKRRVEQEKRKKRNKQHQRKNGRRGSNRARMRITYRRYKRKNASSPSLRPAAPFSCEEMRSAWKMRISNNANASANGGKSSCIVTNTLNNIWYLAAARLNARNIRILAIDIHVYSRYSLRSQSHHII